MLNLSRDGIILISCFKLAAAYSGEGDSAYWTKVGAMWPHENGKGFDLCLSCIPHNGRLVICEAKTDKQAGEQERGR